jgi:hypothetical protein
MKCDNCGTEFQSIHHWGYHYRAIKLNNRTCEEQLVDDEKVKDEITEYFSNAKVHVNA